MPQHEPGHLGNGVHVWKEEDAHPESIGPPGISQLRDLDFLISLGIAGASSTPSPPSTGLL